MTESRYGLIGAGIVGASAATVLFGFAKTDPLPFFGVMHHWNPHLQWEKDQFGIWRKVDHPVCKYPGYDARGTPAGKRRTA